VHTPVIEKIEIVRHGSARRAKLYYLRKLTGKATKIKERRGADGEIINEPAYEAPIATAKVSVPEVGQAPTVEEVVAEVAEASLANPEVISEDVTAVATDEAKADAPTKG
jgi:hypothetical protein